MLIFVNIVQIYYDCIFSHHIIISKYVILVRSFGLILTLAVTNTCIRVRAFHTNLVYLIFSIGEKRGTIERKS